MTTDVLGLKGTFAITGAGSGIGRAVAERFAAAGAHVAVLDIDESAAARVADGIGGEAHRLDVADPDRVDEVVDALGPLQGLVHCAGVAEIAPIVSTTNEQWRHVTAVQLDGTFFCVRAAARAMLRHRTSDGTIVTMASINSFFTHRGLGAYAAAKAGISMLTKAAALELAQAGIRVNAIAPGIVATGMTRSIVEDAAAVSTWDEAIPLGRIGRPDDIADVILFLSTPLSRWVTGQTISVDGGATLRIEPKMSTDGEWTPDALRSLLPDPDPSTGT
jgi:NAD(P)-dependent dehydrogenase (short-subunit alcohol dehydrogenase family)